MTTFMQTLVGGNKGAFRPETLTPMQKLTLRFVIVGVVYYAFAVIEGMLMRIYAVEPISLIPPDQYFGILTAHPLVGIFGSTYMLVFGAFPVLLLLTYAPVTISGLGIREPLVALFFAGAMKPDLGIGVGLLIDLVEYAIPALVGIVALPPLLRALRASFGRTPP